MASIELVALRRFFKHLQPWRAFYEATGKDVISSGGVDYSLHDFEALWGMSRPMLSPRQAEAIELCLIMDMRERDAAVVMGIAPSNPVYIYANDGLKRIIKSIYLGDLPDPLGMLLCG